MIDLFRGVQGRLAPDGGFSGMETRMRRLMIMLVVLLAMTADGMCHDLPGNKQDLKFDALMTALDLDNPALVFVYKDGRHQGSSVGFHVAEPGHRKSGTFLPYNTSSDPEAEVLSYRLALGRERDFSGG